VRPLATVADDIDFGADPDRKPMEAAMCTGERSATRGLSYEPRRSDLRTLEQVRRSHLTGLPITVPIVSMGQRDVYDAASASSCAGVAVDIGRRDDVCLRND
jgi:hypothetical protein